MDKIRVSSYNVTLINKKVVTNNTEIAECLNQYFAEIGSKLTNNVSQSTNGKAFHHYVHASCHWNDVYITPNYFG